MKIALFSPVAPEHSEIANHTERLLGELRARHEVRVFTETGAGFSEPARGRTYAMPLGEVSTELLLSLNEVDLPIYNLGNHPVYFSKTWFLTQEKPGIVILHDLKLHHFYAGIFQMQLKDMPRYLAALREGYGRLGYEAGLAYWQQKISVEFMAQHFPMTAWAVRHALAVVTHTPHAEQALSQLTHTPVRMIPLAYEPKALERTAWPEENIDANGRFTPDRPARIILFGYLNVNRRIVEFLAALAVIPERDRFLVQLVGTMLNLSEVEAAVAALGLTGQVAIHGYVTEADLEGLLHDADLAINLRYPTMGEASGSQLRIWDHALPSLVTRTEGYATLPPEAVFFVDPDSERADIQSHLRGFLERPGAFYESGQAGRRWLLEHHLPSMYVASLDELIDEADTLRSRHGQMVLADRVGAAGASWMHPAFSAGRENFYAASISQLV